MPAFAVDYLKSMPVVFSTFARLLSCFNLCINNNKFSTLRNQFILTAYGAYLTLMLRLLVFFFCSRTFFLSSE